MQKKETEFELKCQIKIIAFVMKMLKRCAYVCVWHLYNLNMKTGKPQAEAVVKAVFFSKKF